MTDFYLNFNHTELKDKMIELLNQFEYVDKSHKDDISFAKPEHSRQLRKIYNKMNDILENKYKNIPKELEIYNKNTPKEEKPKKQPKTIKTQKQPKTPQKPPKTPQKPPETPIKGGDNIDNSRLSIFKKFEPNIAKDNDNQTSFCLTETEKPRNKSQNIIDEITSLYKKIFSKNYSDKNDYDNNFIISYKSQLEYLINYIKNNINDINKESKKQVNDVYSLCKCQIKEINLKYGI